MEAIDDAGSFGNYEVVRALGEGGMGTVYLARRIGEPEGRPVVIKTLRRELSASSEKRLMFDHEARLGTHLEHPHIASVHEVGEQDGRPYLVMEYVEGPALSLILERLPVLPFSVILRIVSAVAEALHHAHSARDDEGTPLQVVHRDVTPHNILVSVHGDVKLIDFGVARSAQQDHKTITGVLKGKLSYMSPEQFRGKVDQRTDIWALGVVLYELLTGERLFVRPTHAETMAAVLLDPIPPISGPPALRAELGPILDKALAREPRARYASADAFHRDLEAAMKRLGLSCGRTELAIVIRDVAERLADHDTTVTDASDVTATPQWKEGLRFEATRQARPAARTGLGGPNEDRITGEVTHPLIDDEVTDTTTTVVEAAVAAGDIERWAAAELEAISALRNNPPAGADTDTAVLNPDGLSVVTDVEDIIDLDPAPDAFADRSTVPRPKKTHRQEPTIPVRMAPVEPAPRPAGPRRLWLVGLLAGTALAAAVVGFVLGLPDGDPEEAAFGSTGPVVDSTPEALEDVAPSLDSTDEDTPEPAVVEPPEIGDPESADDTPAEATEITEPADTDEPPAVRQGLLFLRTEPWSRVRIGGRDVGTTPINGVRLPAGVHVVELTDPDGNVHRRRVPVRAGQSTRRFLRLGR